MSTKAVSVTAPPKVLKKTSASSVWIRAWRSRVSYIMLLPMFIPFFVFIIVPVFQSANVSFKDYSAVSTDESKYIGFDNYTELLSLQIREQTPLYDEESGERMYQCGRRKRPESEVAAYEAEEGKQCTAAFVSSRDLLGESYREWQTYDLFGKNYVIGARDPRFWTAIVNTLYFVAYTVVGKLILGLLVALILRKQSRLNYFLRMVFFLPSVTASIAVTVIWGWIFRGQSYGLLNNMLIENGIVSQPISFLNDADWTMPILVIMAIWGGFGYNMILFLAGLQNINQELYEVAAIDGAGPWASFRRITWPLLRPTTLYVVITSIIGGFQVFDSIYILYANSEGLGGPLDSGLTVVPYLYDKGFRLFQMGYASAIAWVLFIVIFFLTLINLRVGRVNEAY